jgi:hypothetical protein
MIASSKKKRLYNVSLLLILILVWVFIFLSSGIFKAKFNYFLDDHQIIQSHRQYTTFNDIVIQPFAYLFSNDQKYRFRPLYDVLLRFFAYAYGLTPFFWYLSNFIVATVTTSLFCLVARQLNFSVLESGLFAAIAMFGEQSTTFNAFSGTCIFRRRFEY